MRADILKRNAERAPAFGRALPVFRAAAAKQVIDETAAANAQFSLVSNIPTILPVIGNIAAAGADFIVLTKNQVMMLYKLAAVFGRDLRDQRGILQDVLPVVGAGLVWRTVARQAPRGCHSRPERSPSWRSPTSGRWRSAERRSFTTALDSSRRDRRWINSCDKPRTAAPARLAWDATRIQKQRRGLGWRTSSSEISTVIREGDQSSDLRSGRS